VKKSNLSTRVGRPTKYIPNLIFPKIDEYIESCSREQTKLPTVEGLALFLDVNKDTIMEWDKRHSEFSVYLKKVADKQKEQLMNDGMYGGKEVNASMAIFLLKAIHKLRDGNNESFGMEFKNGEKSMRIVVTRGNATGTAQ
jgi:hypothetical protein